MENLKNIMDTFRERLKELIQERNLTIKKLSEETKIPRTTLNNYTLNLRTPKIDVLVTLAVYFKVSVDYLLGLED